MCSVVEFTPTTCTCQRVQLPTSTQNEIFSRASSDVARIATASTAVSLLSWASLMSPEPSRLSPPSPSPSPEPSSPIRTPMTSPDPSTSPLACQSHTSTNRKLKLKRTKKHQVTTTTLPSLSSPASDDNSPTCPDVSVIRDDHVSPPPAPLSPDSSIETTDHSPTCTIGKPLTSGCMTPDELLSAVSNENDDYTSVPNGIN